MGAFAPLFFCLKCVFLATKVIYIYIVDNRPLAKVVIASSSGLPVRQLS